MRFRKGQWVKLRTAGTLTTREGRTVSEKKDTVGIHVGPAMRDGDPKKGEPEKVPVREGLQEVHLVDPVEGTTREVVAVEEKALQAVISRGDIPKKRLATYDKKWVPLP